FFAKTASEVFRLLRPYFLLSLLMAIAWLALVVVDRPGSGSNSRRPTVLAGIYGIAFVVMELGLLHKLTLAVGGPTTVLSVLLFALLLFCGLGSLISARWTSFLRHRLGSGAILVALVGIFTAQVIERCYRLDGVSSSLWRAACVLALVAPIGLCLGV